MNRPIAQTAVTSWRKAELLLDTPMGEEVWTEHLRIVTALRLRYAVITGLMGAVVGIMIFAGVSSWLVGFVAMVAAPFIAWSWAVFTRHTIAPFAEQRRQPLLRLIFVVLVEVVVVLDLFTPLSPAWSVIAAGAVASPWWVSVLLEFLHRPRPYPSAWREAIRRY